MSNTDNSSQQPHHHNPFDSLMQSLGLDSHHPTTPDPNHQDLHNGQNLHHHSSNDWQHSSGQSAYPDISSGFSHHETHYQGIESSPTSDFNHPNSEFYGNWNDQVNHYPTNDFDQTSHPAHSDWHQTDYHQYHTPEPIDYSGGHHLHHHLGGMEHQPQHLMSTDNYHISKDDKNSVKIYNDGDVYWQSGGGKAGHIDGNNFYNNGNHYIGKLGGDMKVYNAHDKCVGWVDAHGRAYTTSGVLFAEGGTARWAAAVLVYNTCSPDS